MQDELVGISVIIPSYNRRELLRSSVKSVLQQSYHNYELIIVDDGSTDNTELDYINNSVIKFIKTKNRGVSSARNIGIQESKENYICFLDSDDIWHKDKLKEQVKDLENNPAEMLFFTNEKWIRNQKIITKKSYQKKQGGSIFEKCVQSCMIGASTVLVAKNLFNKIGVFDESFPVCEDYDLWIRASQKYNCVYNSKELVDKIAGHANQLSFTHKDMDYYRLKSLTKICSSNQHELSVKQIEIIKTKANYYIGMLEKAYLKYNNQEKLQELVKLKYKILQLLELK